MGVICMKKEDKEMGTQIQDKEKTLDFMENIQDIINKTIKEQGLTKREIEKALNYQRRK